MQTPELALLPSQGNVAIKHLTALNSGLKMKTDFQFSEIETAPTSKSDPF